MLINKYFPIIEKKLRVSSMNSFLMKIINRMENCYPHLVTYLQNGKCRLSRLHTVTLRHRVTPEKEEIQSFKDFLQNQCSENFQMSPFW